jgi:hypothetical protein
MIGARWIVGGGALLVAVVALYVLLNGGHDLGSERGLESDPQSARELQAPALDDIDEESRSAMRDLLRRADSEE